MRSPPVMSPEHGQDGPVVSLSPFPIVAGDEPFAPAISADAAQVSPTQYHWQYQQYHHHNRQRQQKQQPGSSDPAIYSPSSVASSPEARPSLSRPSTGSYSASRGNNWDSAMSSSSSYPAEPVSTPPDIKHADISRAEAGLVAGSYKEGHTRLSWAAEVSLSDGHNSRSLHDTANTVTVYTAEDKERDSVREPNAVLVLLLFSTPIPFFSLCTCIYTVLALLLVIFTTPLRLCPPTTFFRSTTFSTQLCKLLAPALRKHERLAQSSTSDHQHNNISLYHNSPHSATPSTTDHFSAIWLILVLVLAPCLSIGLLLAVWIAAFFWIFAMILGNPDGTENGDDGRAAVLGVNTWWQTWLNKSRISR